MGHEGFFCGPRQQKIGQKMGAFVVLGLPPFAGVQIIDYGTDAGTV